MKKINLWIAIAVFFFSSFYVYHKIDSYKTKSSEHYSRFKKSCNGYLALKAREGKTSFTGVDKNGNPRKSEPVGSNNNNDIVKPKKKMKNKSVKRNLKLVNRNTGTCDTYGKEASASAPGEMPFKTTDGEKRFGNDGGTNSRLGNGHAVKNGPLNGMSGNTDLVNNSAMNNNTPDNKGSNNNPENDENKVSDDKESNYQDKNSENPVSDAENDLNTDEEQFSNNDNEGIEKLNPLLLKENTGGTTTDETSGVTPIDAGRSSCQRSKGSLNRARKYRIHRQNSLNCDESYEADDEDSNSSVNTRPRTPRTVKVAQSNLATKNTFPDKTDNPKNGGRSNTGRRNSTNGSHSGRSNNGKNVLTKKSGHNGKSDNMNRSKPHKKNDLAPNNQLRSSNSNRKTNPKNNALKNVSRVVNDAAGSIAADSFIGITNPPGTSIDENIENKNDDNNNNVSKDCKSDVSEDKCLDMSDDKCSNASDDKRSNVNDKKGSNVSDDKHSNVSDGKCLDISGDKRSNVSDKKGSNLSDGKFSNISGNFHEVSHNKALQPKKSSEGIEVPIALRTPAHKKRHRHRQ